MRILFDPAEPVAQDEQEKTAQGGESQVYRTDWEKRPVTPGPDQVPQHKSQYAQNKIQKQAPETAAAHQMIERAIEQSDQKGK